MVSTERAASLMVSTERAASLMVSTECAASLMVSTERAASLMVNTEPAPELNARLRSVATEAPAPRAAPTLPTGSVGTVGPLPAIAGSGSVTANIHTAAVAAAPSPAAVSAAAPTAAAAPTPDELGNYGASVWLEGEREDQQQQATQSRGQ